MTDAVDRAFEKACCKECGALVPEGSDPVAFPHLPTCSRYPEVHPPFVPVPELDEWLSQRVPDEATG